jgi:hypothetical protein
MIDDDEIIGKIHPLVAEVHEELRKVLDGEDMVIVTAAVMHLLRDLQNLTTTPKNFRAMVLEALDAKR